ncbi:MAG: FkbM family methyltransferase [Planctomycetota bacterium]|nr:FkbM family methyltransferase [Planctomycetota bacterium]
MPDARSTTEPLATVIDRLKGLARRAGRAVQRRIRPDPVRDELDRLAPLASAPRRVPGRAHFLGLELEYADGPSFYYQLVEIFRDGCYDVALDEPAPTIVDCGGNVGVSALRLRALFPDARLTVLEADTSLALLLERNLRAAGDARTSVVPRAVWTEDGNVGFAPSSDDEGHIDPAGRARVECIDIAGLCRSRVDLLKLDVEGAEYDLLRRLRETGALANVLRLAMECHGRGPGPGRLHELLGDLAAGGLTYRVVAARCSPELDPRAAGSRFAAVPVLGHLCMVYAWRG